MALKDYYDRINHVGVPTEDMAATVRFYTDLGFALIYETKNGAQQVCFLENGPTQIEAYTVELDNGWSGQMWADDITGVSDDCEVVARILPSARDRALRGQAIVTRRSYGKGAAWYIGTKLDRSSAEQFFRERILKTDAVPDKKEAQLLSGEKATGENTPLRIQRVKDGQCFEFVFNRCAEQAVEVPVAGHPLYLLMAEAEDGRVVLEPSGTAVYCVSETKKI